jgi:hypothetical protein
MKAGILQLIARGSQDITLTNEPQISFFKTIYRRHSNFSKNEINIKPCNQPDFGKKVVFNIGKFGDLIHKMILQIDLPEIDIRYKDMTYVMLVELLKQFNIPLEVITDGIISDKPYDTYLEYLNNNKDLHEDILYSKNTIPLDELENIINRINNFIKELKNKNNVLNEILNNIDDYKKSFEELNNNDINYDEYISDKIYGSYHDLDIYYKFIRSYLNDSDFKETEKVKIYKLEGVISKLYDLYFTEFTTYDTYDENQVNIGVLRESFILIDILAFNDYNALFEKINDKSELYMYDFLLDTISNLYNDAAFKLKTQLKIQYPETPDKDYTIEKTEIYYYLIDFLNKNTRFIIRNNLDINIIIQKIIDTCLWNFYDSFGVFYNIYASLKEDFTHIYYNLESSSYESYYLYDDLVIDNFLNTKIILPYDKKINYFQKKINEELSQIFPIESRLSINSDPNTVTLYYREYAKKKVKEFHIKNEKILNNKLNKVNNETSFLNYFNNKDFLNLLNINLSNHLSDNLENKEELQELFHNCYLIDLFIIGLVDNLNDCLVSCLNNKFDDQNIIQFFKNNLLLLKEELDEIILENDNYYINSLINLDDIKNLENIYVKNNNFSEKEFNTIFLFKKLKNKTINNKCYNIIDFILKRYEDTMNNSLDEYINNNVLNEEVINELNNIIIEINGIYVFYKIQIDQIPSYTLYSENNFNISKLFNLNITEDNFINGFDIACSLFYNQYSLLVESYNDLYENELLNNNFLEQISLIKYKKKLNSNLQNNIECTSIKKIEKNYSVLSRKEYLDNNLDYGIVKRIITGTEGISSEYNPVWFFNDVERNSMLNNIKSTEELHKLASELATPEYPVWNITRMEENNSNGQPIIYFKKNLDNASFKKNNDYMDIGYLNKNVTRNQNNRLFIFFLDSPLIGINGFIDEFDENLVIENDNSVELTNLNNYFIFKEDESSSFETDDIINENTVKTDLKIIQASWSVEDKELFVKIKNNTNNYILDDNYHCIFELSENISEAELKQHDKFLKIKYNNQFYWLSNILKIDYVCNLYYKYSTTIKFTDENLDKKFIYIDNNLLPGDSVDFKVGLFNEQVTVNYELPEGNLDPVNWFDISNEVLNTFILKDQIEVPDQVFVDSFYLDSIWMSNLEILLIYNIYHLNLLKIKDIQLAKRDLEYGQIFNILVGVFSKMTKNYNNALLFVRYILSEIDLSVNQAGSLFNSQYAHFVPPIIIKELCKQIFYTGEEYPMTFLHSHQQVFDQFKIEFSDDYTIFPYAVEDIILNVNEKFDYFLKQIYESIFNNIDFPSFQNKNIDLTDEEIYKIISNIDTNYYPNEHDAYVYDLENKEVKTVYKNFIMFLQELNSSGYFKDNENMILEKIDKVKRWIDKYIKNGRIIYNYSKYIKQFYNNLDKSSDIYRLIIDRLIIESDLISINETEYYNLRNLGIDNINKFFKNKIKSHINKNLDIINKIEGNISINDGLINQLTYLLYPKNKPNFCWIENIGNYMIKKIRFLINDLIIDEHTGEWLNLFHNLMDSKAHDRGYNIMNGNINSLTNFNNHKKKKHRLYVPLIYWFNRYSNLALPLVALQHSDLKIEVEFRDFDDCNYYDIFTEFIRKPKIKTELITEYIYVEKKERNIIATTKHEYLIENLQYRKDILIDKTMLSDLNIIDIEIKMNNNSKYLAWVFQPLYYTQIGESEVIKKKEYDFELSKYLSKYLNRDLSEKNYIQQMWNKYHLGDDTHILHSMKIMFEELTREKLRNNDYFNFVQTEKYFDRSELLGLYTYSFSKYPALSQPSGSVNLSTFDKVIFRIRLSNEAIKLLNDNKVIKLSIYNVTYNILRIVSGLAGINYFYS